MIAGLHSEVARTPSRGEEDMAITASRPGMEHAWVVVSDVSGHISGLGAVLDPMRSSVRASTRYCWNASASPMSNVPHGNVG